MSGGPGAVEFSGAVCASCGELRSRAELDDGGACPDCDPALRARLKWRPHVIAVLIVLPFAVWIWTLDLSGTLPWYAWLLPLAAAYYLGLRIGREIVRGYTRWMQTR